LERVEAQGPGKAGVLRLRVGTPEMEKMPKVLTSLEKSPTPSQCWPEWKHLVFH